MQPQRRAPGRCSWNQQSRPCQQDACQAPPQRQGGGFTGALNFGSRRAIGSGAGIGIGTDGIGKVF